MARAPTRKILEVAYGSSLAANFGRTVRDFMVEPIVQQAFPALELSQTSTAIDDWMTTEGGKYYACGVGGGTTGRPANLLLIDDPIKNRQEAEQAGTRNKVWNFYNSSLNNRKEPEYDGSPAIELLIQTRWHPDDLAGRLMQEPDADQWRVLQLPALAYGPDDNGVTPSDPLGRAPGQALWPEWEDEAALARKRMPSGVGEVEFQCLYQQNPLIGSGLLFQVEKIEVLASPPPCEAQARGWDLAATSQIGGRDPDWTVGLKLGRRRGGQGFVILDLVRFRGPPEDVEAAIVNTANQDKFPTKVGIPQDPGQAGVAQAKYLTGRLKGHSVTVSRETGSKHVRATPVASQVNVGNIAMVEAPWNRELLEELRYFPHGPKDDIVDALSRAFGLLDNPKSDIWSRLAGKG